MAKSITIDSKNLSRDDMVLIIHEMMDCMGAISEPHKLSDFMDINEDIASRIVDAVNNESKAIIDASNGDSTECPDFI